MVTSLGICDYIDCSVGVLFMRGIKHFLGSLAIAGMMLASSAQPGAAQGGSSGGAADSCAVKVNRNAAPGVFDISRQLLGSGKCRCIVSTGPASQGGSAESALIGLLSRRTCPDAPLADAGAAAGSGGLGTGAIIGGVILVGGGLGAALASGGSKSP